jgi:putative inorganic carbon (HCO3(-)) transporter
MGVAYSRRLLLLVLIVAFIGLGAALVVGPVQLGQLLLAGPGEAVEGLEGRMELWSRALYMIQDFPFTGVGLGMFDPVLDMLYPLFTLGSTSSLFHPHNIFLAQAVMAGIPGLVAFVSMLLLLLVTAIQSVRFSRSGAFWYLALGLLGAVVAYLGHGVFDSIDSFIKASTIVWAIFGLQIALWLYLRTERGGDSRVP